MELTITARRRVEDFGSPVFDVVLTVRPGAISTTPPGRYGIDYSDDLNTARQIAARFNRDRTGARGVVYAVELHEQDCDGRTFGHLDPTAPFWSPHCTCGGGTIR